MAGDFGIAGALADPAEAERFPILRCAFEATGSPAWVMRTIRALGFDHRHGFHLELGLGTDRATPLRQATESALAEGAADLIDTDWISLARHRLAGFPIAAVFPYGRIMGGMVVSRDGGITDLDHLRGHRIGVVRRQDKNWSVIRAACRQSLGFDPAAEATVIEAMSKTTLVEWLEQGRVDAAVVYWHLVPALTETGRFRQLCDVLDLLERLGGATAPTTFFSCRESFIARQPAVIAGFVAAYRQAVALLRSDGAAWRLAAASSSGRPDVAAGLRAAWCRRICTDWQPEDPSALVRLFERLKALIGEEALGVPAIPLGAFSLFPNL